jgi:alpha-1,3-mannosyl-glycoprotein beta-1,2-N-acetylglucosaminyltransferase
VILGEEQRKREREREENLFIAFLFAEDDMLVAPDFFDYFAGLAPILHSDPTLLCVSAWNDNGMRGLVDETSSSAVKELRRTSVFPVRQNFRVFFILFFSIKLFQGLGWMLTRALWDQELRDKWPAAYWDDWLREPAQTRGRDCVYPTVSRSKTIGEIGSSVGQFYDAYLSRIVLNSVKVDWANEPKEYLNRTVYRAALLAQVAAARTVERKDLEMEMERNTPGAIRVYWRNAKQFQKIANTMGMMNDLKAGLPRSSFEGIVRVLTPNKQTLFVVPEHNPQTTSKGKKKEKKRKQDRKKKKKTTTTTSAPATTTGPDEEWEEDEEQVQETKET